MAKMNKYWGFVAVGAITAAAAGAIAAHFAKKNRKPAPLKDDFNDFDDFDDLDDLDAFDNFDEELKEEQEVFQTWESSSHETESQEDTFPVESTDDEVKEETNELDDSPLQGE